MHYTMTVHWELFCFCIWSKTFFLPLVLMTSSLTFQFQFLYMFVYICYDSKDHTVIWSDLFVYRSVQMQLDWCPVGVCLAF